MKTNKSFRLSEEAVKVLDEQENATRYLEDLILGSSSVPVPWLNLEFRIDQCQETLTKKIDALRELCSASTSDKVKINTDGHVKPRPTYVMDMDEWSQI